MVSFSVTTIVTIASFLTRSTLAMPSPTVNFELLDKRAASCTFPTPPSTSSLSAAKIISGTFDGGNVRYQRGAGACIIQVDADASDAVFVLESGATLQNVVIGSNQVEGVHCRGPCTIKNVWFEDVCEAAITIKQTSGTSTISGGGAKGADDKVVQHNGGGTVNIDSYCVQDFGKLYRSCGNCSTMYKRTVNISNVIAKNGKLIAGINSNYGDVATISTSTNSYTSVNSICDTYKGNNIGNEAIKLTSNTANAYCIF